MWNYNVSLWFMHHICHVTWDCMLCNVKCIVTRSLDRSPVRLCSSFRSSIFPVLIVTDRAILQSATVVLLQIGTIFSFHLLHFQSARGFHFLSLMIHWNLLSFWCERWSFFPSSTLDSFILEFDWSPNHSLFCENGFEFKIWLSKTFNNDTYL